MTAWEKSPTPIPTATYQLLSNVSSDRYYPMTEIHQDAGDQESYRFPLRLYVNHRDTGADAGGMFLQKVEIR